MSGKPIKDMIIGTMRNGPETLKELEMAKKTGKDISQERDVVKKKVAQYHPSVLRMDICRLLKPDNISMCSVRLTVCGLPDHIVCPLPRNNGLFMRLLWQRWMEVLYRVIFCSV